MSTKLDEGIKALENVEVDKMQVVPAEPMTPVQMTQYAIQQGANPEQLLKYMELQERAEASEAKRAYHVAMNAFKENPPELHKNKTVRYETSKGTTEYDHASLDNIGDIISKALAPHGLSYHWDTDQTDNGQIRVTCVITHALGHSESVPLQAGPDQSGGKNNIQAVGSTVTYLQRYTLLSATGLAVKGMDNDGQTSEPIERITEEQAADLRSLIDEVKADEAKFLKYIKVNGLEDIAKQAYESAVRALELKRKQ